MDVFEKVQQTRPEIEGEEENISTARRQLLSEIHHAPQIATPRAARRPWIIAGGLVGAAAITAGVLLVSNLTAPTAGRVEAVPTGEPRPLIEPSPTPLPTVEPLTVSSAFGAASSSAASFTGLTVAPGQYLRIEVDTQEVVYYEPLLGSTAYLVDRSNATSAWEMLTTSERYVPADPHGEWRYLGTSLAIGSLYGPQTHQKAQQYLEERGMGTIGQTPIGEPGGPIAPWSVGEEQDRLVDFLESMPKDPAQLVAWIDEHQQTPPELRNTKVGWLLIQFLAENVGSAEVRAAMYEALSLLDGFELTSVVGDVFTVAVVTPFEDASGNPTTVRRTAAIDLSTGLVKETSVTTGSGSSVVPDAVPDLRESYSVTVVDAAP